MSSQYLKKEVRDDINFLHVDKHESFVQVDFNNLGIKVSFKWKLSLLMGMMKHFQSSQSIKFSISLQYFKKEVTNVVFFFCMQINIKFLQVDIIVFDGIGQACSKYPKYFYCKSKHSDILQKHSNILPGSSHVHCCLLNTCIACSDI